MSLQSRGKKTGRAGRGPGPGSQRSPSIRHGGSPRLTDRLYAAALFVASSPAVAETTVTAFLNATTNYVYRAYTKSEDRPTLQANFDLLHARSGLIAGAWVAAVDFGGARLEAYPYAGRRWRITEDWRLDTMLAAYLYDDRVFEESANYLEAQALLHYRDLLSLRAGTAPDAYGRGGNVLNLQIDARYPLSATVDVSAGLGYDRARPALGYDDVYWNLGLTWFPTRHLSADLRYYDAAEFNGAPELGDGAAHGPFEDLLIDPAVVFTVTVGF